MSWKGFTKAINRLPAMIAKSTGSSQETKDEEFIALEQQFKQVDSISRILAAETRKYKDSLTLVLYHQETLSNHFATLTPDSIPAVEFARGMKGAKEELQQDLEQLERLVVGPTTDLIGLLDIVKRMFVKRGHKLLDYDRHAEAVKVLRDKPNRTASDEKRLAQAEATFENSARDYNSINNLLKQDLQVFMSLRVAFIDPILLTFYNYQVRVYETLYRIYYQIGQSQFDLSTGALGGYQKVAEDLGAMLASLTVCKGLSKSPVEPPLPTSSSQPQSSSYTTPSQPQTHESVNKIEKSFVIALYDFDAQAEGDLSFKRDDKIEVLERKEDVNDWWTGRIGERVGQFPGNYTAPL